MLAHVLSQEVARNERVFFSRSVFSVPQFPSCRFCCCLAVYLSFFSDFNHQRMLPSKRWSPIKTAPNKPFYSLDSYSFFVFLLIFGGFLYLMDVVAFFYDDPFDLESDP